MHDSRGCPLFQCDCTAFDEETNRNLASESDEAFYHASYSRESMATNMRNGREANT